MIEVGDHLRPEAGALDLRLGGAEPMPGLERDRPRAAMGAGLDEGSTGSTAQAPTAPSTLAWLQPRLEEVEHEVTRTVEQSGSRLDAFLTEKIAKLGHVLRKMREDLAEQGTK